MTGKELCDIVRYTNEKKRTCRMSRKEKIMRTVFVANNINTTNSISMLKKIIWSIAFVHSYKGKNDIHTAIDI